LDGKAVAAALDARLASETERLKSKGVRPTLAILRIGERGDDVAYERGALKRAETLGVAIRRRVFETDVSRAEFLSAVRACDADESVHGALIFRPLPAHVDETAVRAALSPEKDVDGITDFSMAGVYAGTALGFPPCTAAACLEILGHYGVQTTGKRAVVVGRSLVVGRPVAMLLLERHATVTLCHTKTRDLARVCREAEILIVAAGVAGAIGAECCAAGQIVLDVGIHAGPNGEMCGDVDFAACAPIVEAITPTPGGVGAVTTSVLMKHTIAAAVKAAESRKVEAI
jgi:methylenetetrahydrofolate dehydrogenase (NADP+)/methenyltetrahydrofolate cyclohydrolase